MLQNFEDLENASSKAALWLLIRKDLMSSRTSRNIPSHCGDRRSVVILAIVLAVLRAFTSQHYFMEQ